MPICDQNLSEADIIQYSEKKAAALLGLSPKTLQKYRIAGGGPKFVHVSGRCIRYRLCDLKTWQEFRLRESTSDTGPAEASAPRRARRVK